MIPTSAKRIGARVRRHLARWIERDEATAAAPEPLCDAERNHRFAADVIREARERDGTDDLEVTYAEKVVAFFIKGIHRPMFSHYVRYALGSLARGEKLVKLYASDDAAVASYLDVGCAYGGAPIAMARRGVPRAVGFEYDGRLLGLAKTLAAEQGVSDRVKFVAGDLTCAGDVAPLGRFDLVTCIDVLEHVLDPEAAIANLATLAADGGTVVVDVPNPRSYELVEKDPHHHLFGSVLLERDDAIRAFEDESPGNKRYTVGYFHPLEWYVERLERAGFAVDLMDTPAVTPEAVADSLDRLGALRAGLDEISAGWPAWRTELVTAALDRFFDDAGDYRALADRDPRSFQERHAVPVYHLRCTLCNAAPADAAP